MQSPTIQIENITNLKMDMPCSFISFLLIILFTMLSSSMPGYCEFAQPLLPPTGSGNTAALEVAGDTNTPPAVPSGNTQASQGSIFATVRQLGRTVVYVYWAKHNAAGKLLDKHMALTISPATLTTEQVSDISGILGINMLSGQQAIQADASSHQLELIQAVLAKSANDATLGLVVPNGTSKQIVSDPTAAQWSKLRQAGDDARYIYAGSIPFVRTIARWIVISAVIFATVYLIFAAFSVTAGQLHGASRVVAAAGGLMLFLMGYTIYKVAIVNLFNQNSVDNPAITTQHFSNLGQVKPQYWHNGDTPGTPRNIPAGTSRSGIPVQPLSGN